MGGECFLEIVLQSGKDEDFEIIIFGHKLNYYYCTYGCVCVLTDEFEVSEYYKKITKMTRFDICSKHLHRLLVFRYVASIVGEKFLLSSFIFLFLFSSY